MTLSDQTPAFCQADFADLDMRDGEIVQGVEGDYVRLSTNEPLLAPHPGFYVVTLAVELIPSNVLLGWSVGVVLSGSVEPGAGASIDLLVPGGDHVLQDQVIALAAVASPGAFQATVVARWDTPSPDTWICNWQMQLVAWRQGVRYAP
jgi:hypothetical protein